jgi:hypothetical protein
MVVSSGKVPKNNSQKRSLEDKKKTPTTAETKVRLPTTTTNKTRQKMIRNARTVREKSSETLIGGAKTAVMDFVKLVILVQWLSTTFFLALK